MTKISWPIQILRNMRGGIDRISGDIYIYHYQENPLCHGNISSRNDISVCDNCGERWEIPYKNLEMLFKMKEFRGGHVSRDEMCSYESFIAQEVE